MLASLLYSIITVVAMYSTITLSIKSTSPIAKSKLYIADYIFCNSKAVVYIRYIAIQIDGCGTDYE